MRLPPKTICAFLPCLLLPGLLAAADDPPEIGVTVQAQAWQLPPALAWPLVARLREPASAPAAIEDLRRLHTEGRATLLAQLRASALPTTGRQRAKSGTETEERYADEFGGRFIARWAWGISNYAYFYGSPSIIPYSTETLSHGFELEIEVFHATRTSATLSAILQRRVFDGYSPHPIGVTYGGVKVFRTARQFHTFKAVNTQTLPTGQWTLFGAYAPRRAGDPVEIHLCKAVTRVFSNP